MVLLLVRALPAAHHERDEDEGAHHGNGDADSGDQSDRRPLHHCRYNANGWARNHNILIYKTLPVTSGVEITNRLIHYSLATNKTLPVTGGVEITNRYHCRYNANGWARNHNILIYKTLPVTSGVEITNRLIHYSLTTAKTLPLTSSGKIANRLIHYSLATNKTLPVTSGVEITNRLIHYSL